MSEYFYNLRNEKTITKNDTKPRTLNIAITLTIKKNINGKILNIKLKKLEKIICNTIKG